MGRRHSHCSYCGSPFTEGAPFPRACTPCGNVTYVNPIPVGVMLLPVDGGLLCIRRDIEPGRGKLALPGGYVDLNETWQMAAVREMWEETGISVPVETVTLFRVWSSTTGDGILLILALGPSLTAEQLPAFQPTNETCECVIIREPQELAFDLHTRAAAEYFAALSPSPAVSVPRVGVSA